MDLKSAAVGGMAWALAERAAAYVLQFAAGMAVARRLSPGDYGMMGMLLFFITIAFVVADGGMASALIQKRDRTGDDFSTAFWYNAAASLAAYAAIFLCAPAIASFYGVAELVPVARTVALDVVICAAAVVPTACLTARLDFRTQTAATVSALVVSGAVGIGLAYSGFGVWALVWQALSASAVRLAVCGAAAGWRPGLSFSAESFGSRMFASTLVGEAYSNCHALVIGRRFSAADIGLYNRGRQLADIAAVAASEAAVKVAYPVFAELRDDEDRLMSAYRRFALLPLLAIVPAVAAAWVFAEPLVSLLLGERWLGCVPYLRVLCFGSVWILPARVGMSLVGATGRSDLVLKLELLKKPLGFAILFATMPFGVWWICVGAAAFSFAEFAISAIAATRIRGGRAVRPAAP